VQQVAIDLLAFVDDRAGIEASNLSRGGARENFHLELSFSEAPHNGGA
jgi:hypothetical protein